MLWYDSMTLRNYIKLWTGSNVSCPMSAFWYVNVIEYNYKVRERLLNDQPRLYPIVITVNWQRYLGAFPRPKAQSHASCSGMLQQRGQVQTRRIYIKLSNPKVAKVLAIAWDAMDMSDVTDQGGPLYHVFWLYMFTGFLKRQSSKAFIFARGVLPFIVLHRVGFPVVGLEVCCHCATDLIWRTDVQETAWRIWRCPWHADILKFSADLRNCCDPWQVARWN